MCFMVIDVTMLIENCSFDKLLVSYAVSNARAIACIVI